LRITFGLTTNSLLLPVAVYVYSNFLSYQTLGSVRVVFCIWLL